MSAVTTETSTTNAISVSGLRKSYGELEAVRGIAPSPPTPSPFEGEGRSVVSVSNVRLGWGEGA